MFNLVRIFAVCLFALGCSKNEETPAKQPAQSSKGEPIRGEPIRSPVAVVPTNEPTTTTTVPATTTPTAASNAPIAQTSTASVAKTSTPPSATSSSEKPEFVQVGFDKLSSYTFNVPDGVIPTNQIGKSAEQIPQEVKSFDQQKVALKGFMLPLKVDNGRVTEMLIMKDQSMCCYGAIPRINDWVSVKMKTDGVKSVMDAPVVLYGKLSVGEMIENGYLIGIYEMAGEKMAEVKE